VIQEYGITRDEKLLIGQCICTVMQECGITRDEKLLIGQCICTVMQEYGITRDEKLLIGQCICTPLLRKVLADFERNAEEEEESTRLDSRCECGFGLFTVMTT